MLAMLEHGISRHAVMGAEFHSVDIGQTLALAQEAMSKSKRLQHSDINVAKIVQMASDPVLRSDVLESDLICVDGMGVKWACRR